MKQDYEPLTNEEIIERKKKLKAKGIPNSMLMLNDVMFDE